MKAGGSAGHRLVLSCQGAECHPWAHSRGMSWMGLTPCLALSRHPRSCGIWRRWGKRRKRHPHSLEKLSRGGCEVIDCSSFFSPSCTTDFMSNTNVWPVCVWTVCTEAAPESMQPCCVSVQQGEDRSLPREQLLTMECWGLSLKRVHWLQPWKLNSQTD